jgi:hypothetical protein
LPSPFWKSETPPCDQAASHSFNGRHQIGAAPDRIGEGAGIEAGLGVRIRIAMHHSLYTGWPRFGRIPSTKA